LSLDHQALSAVSRIRLSEREEESLSCFLRACDAALSYLQELDKMVNTPHAKTTKASLLSTHVDIDLGYFLQAALQSAYLCLLQRGKRKHLSVPILSFIAGLKVLNHTMKLAQVLLTSVSEGSYWPPQGPPPAVWLQREGAAASKDAMYPTIKPPLRYSTDW
ncbi:hypothetical protein GOODEAATRI_031207, partial [Goodea atripinnis]